MEVDFLEANCDNDFDDVTLSQICQNLENKILVFEGMFDLSLDLNNDGYDDVDVGMGTGHGLDVKPELQPVEISTRFWTTVTKEELKTLMSNQENSNTKSNTRRAVNVFEKQGEKRAENVPELRVMKEKKDGAGYPTKSVYLI